MANLKEINIYQIRKGENLNDITLDNIEEKHSMFTGRSVLNETEKALELIDDFNYIINTDESTGRRYATGFGTSKIEGKWVAKSQMRCIGTSKVSGNEIYAIPFFINL